MIIKNMILPNENYLDESLKILCKNNISFVYIKEDKELHFDNFIVRFFFINKLIKTFDFDPLYEITNDIFSLLDNNEKQEYIDCIDNKNYNQLKKDDYKRNSNLVNIELKNNSKKIKTIKKQLNPSRRIYKNL